MCSLTMHPWSYLRRMEEQAVDGFEKQQCTGDSWPVGSIICKLYTWQLRCWKIPVPPITDFALVTVLKRLRLLCLVLSIHPKNIYWAPTLCQALPGAIAVSKTNSYILDFYSFLSVCHVSSVGFSSPGRQDVGLT